MSDNNSTENPNDNLSKRIKTTHMFSLPETQPPEEYDLTELELKAISVTPVVVTVKTHGEFPVKNNKIITTSFNKILKDNQK